MDHPNQRLSSSTLLSSTKLIQQSIWEFSLLLLFTSVKFFICGLWFWLRLHNCKVFSRGSLLFSECISKFRMGNVIHKCFHWVENRVDLTTCLVGRKKRMCSITLSGYSDNRSSDQLHHHQQFFQNTILVV